MTLAAGTKVGPYEVVTAIGHGGMGEVYRAHDTKLGRDVALKVLPDSFASNPERVARFQREAQVLASLNHPHIGTIYGFEDGGLTKALVLELVEGPTLADRIAEGSVPVEEARPIARQMAEALEAAHEQGIIHRDLKPANIKIRGDGTVKVLDFGLAKALEAPGANLELSQSPTITTPAMTQAGVLLGTAAYMSPEVAKGRPADKRSDIWAFGCVLYELLTGRRAFDGNDMTEVLGAVVRLEPDWHALPGTVPAGVVAVLKRCLQKDPNLRLRDIADVRLQLEDGFAAPVSSAQPLARGFPRAGYTGWVVAAVVAIGAAVALSPDGRTIAVERMVNGNTDVWLMDTDRGGFRRLTFDPAVDGEPLFSPDGSRVLFVSDGKANVWDMYERRTDGTGSNTLVFESNEQKNPRDWSPDGRYILYGSQSPKTGNDLWALPLVGERKPIAVATTAFEETDGRFSPDGRSVAYASTESGQAEIYLQPFPGAGPKSQISNGGGTRPRWRGDGRELYYVGPDNHLMAVSFSERGSGTAVAAPRDLFKIPGTWFHEPSRDGERFLISTVVSEASPITVILNWKSPFR